jgi:hypothetical protein
VIAEAEAQAAARLDECDRRCVQLLAEARTDAERIVASARQSAEEVRTESADERRRAEDSLAHLRAERQVIVDELGRLRGAIKALIGIPGAEDALSGETPSVGVPIAPVAAQEIDLREPVAAAYDDTRLDIPVEAHSPS